MITVLKHRVAGLLAGLVLGLSTGVVPNGGAMAQTCKFDKRSLQPLPFDLHLKQPEPDKPEGDQAGDGGSAGQDGEQPQPPSRTFAYYPPGEINPKNPSRNRGRTGDRLVYAPNMIFPLKLPNAMHPHMNSQIYGYGGGGWGGKGAAGGSECDPRNYDPFKQRDNYCEVRGWRMPLCPSGTGHQGLDIRPPDCRDAKWQVVAVVDGKITRVTRNTTVVLKGDDGTYYYYLHMDPRTIPAHVRNKGRVRQGDVLGKVSKYMKGRRLTTIHLHFMARQNVMTSAGKSLRTYVPIYTSLIAALRKAKGLGPSIDKNGNLIVDANYEIGAKVPEPPPADPDADATPEPPTKPDTPVSTDPGDSSGPVVDDQDASGDLTERIAALERELTELKVESDREIEVAQGRASAAEARIAILEDELARAGRRLEEQDSAHKLSNAAAAQREADLKTRLDQTLLNLERASAELRSLKEGDNAPSVWERARKWWKDLWGYRAASTASPNG